MNKLRTLDDLRNHLWEMLGRVDMETVDKVLDVVKRNPRLLAQHDLPGITRRSKSNARP